MHLILIASEISEKWQYKAWRACTKVYGIQNLDNMHWVAYEYEFLEKEVKVYDSMTNVFYVKCQKVFEMHAAIVPSLYNIGCEEGDNKMDPDVSFTFKFVPVSQQPNHHDCGVYAIKYMQCLTMRSDLNSLKDCSFPEFRKKLGIDLVLWAKTNDGKYSFTEREIRM
ncbi:hypothetical protein LIER_02249 [Lithospermum erythrorhizon]|uniref:Ubiquitin-like protease family profile domain-containing protein n=1 Tax=Lithospermum erythrorhizon TaxID=34254 RepID=A0AAV3NNR6_LITER